MLGLSGIFTSLLSHCCWIQYRSPNPSHCHLSLGLSQPPSSLSRSLTFPTPHPPTPMPGCTPPRRLFSKWLYDHISALLNTFQENPVALGIKSDICNMAFHNLTSSSDLILNLCPCHNWQLRLFSTVLCCCKPPVSPHPRPWRPPRLSSRFAASAFPIGQQRERRGRTWFSHCRANKVARVTWN